MARQTVHDRQRNRPVRPEFTVAQSQALRAAIDFGLDSSDGHFRRALRNAQRELERAERKANA